MKSLHLSDLEITDSLLYLQTLEDINFTNCIFSTINNNMLSGFVNLNTVSFMSCKINKIDHDAFNDLKNLVEIRFMECNINSLDCEAFSKLTSLKCLSFHANTVNSNVNYEVFKQLPSLENIFFDLDTYKNMNFSGYSKLRTVRLGFCDDSNTLEDDLRKSIMTNLKERNIDFELVFTGKVEVNMDEVQICG